VKITRYSFWRENLELTRPYTIAFKTTDSVENIFFEVELSNGKTGLGACNVSPQVVGVTLDDCWNFFSNEDLSWLVGSDIREIGKLQSEIVKRYSENPGVRAAMDISLFDAFGQYLGIPLVNFFGRAIEALPTSVTIGIKDVDETLEEAKEYKSNGFRVLKVKLGHDVDLDIARLRKLHEEMPEMIVRVDANQGYSFDDLVRFFEETENYDLELIEQPVPVDKVMQLHELSSEQISLLAADESLINPEDASKILGSNPLFGIFNIKLMKTGGIYQARKIGNLAGIYEVPLMWGCNDESIVSISAALAAAYSFPWTKYIDLDGSFDLARDIVKDGFVLKDGYMYPSDKPGLGFVRL